MKSYALAVPSVAALTATHSSSMIEMLLILVSTRYRKATHWDKYFAPLGVITNNIRDRVPVDYPLSLEAVNVAVVIHSLTVQNIKITFQYCSRVFKNLVDLLSTDAPNLSWEYKPNRRKAQRSILSCFTSSWVRQLRSKQLEILS